jgi:hypothetical protein
MITDEIPLTLRSVYQMNCKGGSLVKEWQAVGSEVVNGTSPDKNNYMPSQYFHFMNHWMANKSFAKSTSESFKEAKLYFQIVYALQQELIPASYLYTKGNANIKITSP